MTKDDRIVVRMSAELRAWVHEQAQLGEQDDAAFVRMVLSNVRRGATTAPMLAVPAPVAAPMVRDVLSVATPVTQGYPAAGDAGGDYVDDRPQSAAPAIDIDAMVGDAFEQAEAEGLTERQIEEGQGDMPDSGVRPLFRRPVPFSRGTQPMHLQQLLGN